MSLRQKLGAALYDAMMKKPERAGLRSWRRELLEHARGDVLEIGIGSGANLPHYPDEVGRLIAVDPNPEMIRRIDIDSFAGQGPVEIVEGYAHQLPLADDCVDTVVSTLVLCSVRDIAEALAEIRRVMSPKGRFLFLEHVASHKPKVRRWQDRIDPLWHWCTGDCHMNRQTREAIEEAGFCFETLQREPMPKTPSLLRPAIRGVAVPC